MTLRYPYVCVLLTEEQAELCALELWELGASGIEQRDASTLTRPDPALQRGDDAGVLLLAGFEDEPQAQAAVRALMPRWEASVTFVEGDDWKHAWKAYFKPTRVGERLVVRPSWEPFDASARDLVITIDPGTAFGTGTHETTRLVLRALEAQVRPGMAVLDVGCGSGILSIAATLLGASRVDAIDVDPEAVRIALQNVVLNGVADRVHTRTEEPSHGMDVFPLVVANIETRTLVPLAPLLIERVAPGGVLVLSGVLAPERQTLEAAYGELEQLGVEGEGEWIALSYRRGPQVSA